jgi:hypothetical protein
MNDMLFIIFEYVNNTSVLLTISLVSVLLYVIFRIKLYQQEHAYPISPVSTPPFNLSPGVLRYLAQKRVDSKIFYSTIIFFAEQGYITINKKQGEFYLTNTQKDRNKLLRYEQEVLTILFKEKNSIAVSGDILQGDVAELSNARKALNQGIHQSCDTHYFSNVFYPKALFIIPALFLFIIALIVNIYTVQIKIILIVLVCASLLRKLFRYTRLWYTSFYLYKSSISGFRFITGTILFLIIISVSLIVLLSLGHDYHITFNLIVLASLCFINFSLFFSSLYNADGVKIVNQIKGFKLYLLQNSMNDLISINDSTEFYKRLEKYLPYAIALDKEQPWIKAINLAMKKNSMLTSFYYPTWYIGVSLGDQNFIHSIIYVFLPSLNSLILENDLLNKRFSYVVDSNTDL